MRFNINLIRFCMFCYWFSGKEAVSFPYVYPRLFLSKKVHNAGEPLILTPYLNRNEIEIAQNLSRVSITEDLLEFRSHAGFFTINETQKSNMYFWYFPTFSKNKDAPVLIWLQGGPGASSLFGLFTELGPLIASGEGIDTRKYHWALTNHLIFIENPVGTGFSFTKSDFGYCNTETCIGENLYLFMKQFYTLFPKLKDNELYLTGESYAGKYIPSLAMAIHQHNQVDTFKMNLKGLAMGNAYIDPIHQMDYGSYLYQIGLIDLNQKDKFENLQDTVKTAINNKEWALADLLMDKMMDGEISKSCYFKNFTGFMNYYNYLMPNDEPDMSFFKELLEDDQLRREIHVGGVEFSEGEAVREHLAFDMLQSVAPIVSKLLSHYRIMLYNGQLDIVVAYPLTENFLHNLDFSSKTEYKTAKRKIWMVDGEVAGYIKKAGNLTEVLVRNAGHMVPHDQPKWALELITKFIKNKL